MNQLISDIQWDSLVIPEWMLFVGAVIVSTGFMIVLKRIILGRLERVISRTRYKMDSVLIHALNFPSTLIVLVINLAVLNYLLVEAEVTSERIASIISVSVKVLLIVALIIFVDRFSSGAIGNYADRSIGFRSSKGIAQGVARAIILGLGLLVVLSTLGVSITPIIASLGIGSLAVALALQPTLENFFSGVQLVVDKPFRVGDFIELDSGDQGFVEKIGWRSTWVKMLPNNIVILPNSLLSKSRIINYFYPEKELSVPVEVSVHYSSDLDKVEEITLEVAREILKTHEYGVETYNTFVIYHTFDSSSINFTVMLRAHEYFHQFFIRSAFIKALHKRYAEEGVAIPYPIRAINVEQEGGHWPDLVKDK